MSLSTFPRTDINQKGWGRQMSALMCAQVPKNDNTNGKILLLFNNGISVLKDCGIKGINGRASFS